MANLTELFAENVFNMKVMRERLSSATFKSLEKTIDAGKPLDASIADEVAEAMKEWAMDKGATHYTHWLAQQLKSTIHLFSRTSRAASSLSFLATN